MPVLGMNIKDLFKFLFQGLLVSTKHTSRYAIPKINQVLIITILPWLAFVNTFNSVSLTKSVRNKTCVATHTFIVQEY